MKRALLLLALFVAGCGTDEGTSPKVSTRLVDPSGQPPLINSFDRVADGRYLLTTNRGFFRIDPATGRVETIRSTVQTSQASSPVGKYLEFSLTDQESVWLGSGHPDDSKALPAYLGFMRSDDAGRTWHVLSRLGEADLHEIIQRGQRVYAFDAVTSALLISVDGGRTYAERPTPRGLVLSMAVNPGDPRRTVIATDDQVYRSSDDGRSWRPVAGVRGPRVAWPSPRNLLRTEADGPVMRSSDAGSTWKRVGTIKGGEPYKLVAFDDKRLAVALSDGAIVESSDGGASWKSAFEP